MKVMAEKKLDEFAAHRYVVEKRNKILRLLEQLDEYCGVDQQEV